MCIQHRTPAGRKLRFGSQFVKERRRKKKSLVCFYLAGGGEESASLISSLEATAG